MASNEKTVEQQLSELVTALSQSARCKGVTQTAHYMGIERESLSRTLRSSMHMKLATAVKIADALNLQLELKERTQG